MSDLIDRKQAILAVCSVCSAVRPEYRGEKCIHFADGCEEIERLNELPSAQPEPVRHGKWIDIFGDNIKYGTCSLCGDMSECIDTMNYCPNCGVKMRGEDNG